MQVSKLIIEDWPIVLRDLKPLYTTLKAISQKY